MARYDGPRKRVTKFPIARVLEHFGFYLPRTTGRYSVKCMFHDDNVASGSADFTANRFTCFACGASGDAVDLLREHEGLSFAEAVERAKDITGHRDNAVRGEPDAGHRLFE